MNYYPDGFADEDSLNLAVHQLIGEVDELYANVEEHQAIWQETFVESDNPQVNPADVSSGLDRTLIWAALTPTPDLDDILSPYLFALAAEDTRADNEESSEWWIIANNDSPISEEAEGEYQERHDEIEEPKDEGTESSKRDNEAQLGIESSDGLPRGIESPVDRAATRQQSLLMSIEGTESSKRYNEAQLGIESSDGLPRGIESPVDRAVTRLQSLLMSIEGGCLESTSPPTSIAVNEETASGSQSAACSTSAGTDSKLPIPRRRSRNVLPRASSIVIRPDSKKFTEQNECHEASQRVPDEDNTGNASQRLVLQFEGEASSTDDGVPPGREVDEHSHHRLPPFEEEKKILPESEGDASERCQSVRRRPWLESNASALVGTSNTSDSESLKIGQPTNKQDRFIFLQAVLSEHIDSVCEEFREISELVFCNNRKVSKHLQAAMGALSQAKCEIRKDAFQPKEELHFGNLKQEFYQRAIQRLKCNAIVTGVPKKAKEDVRDILKRISYALGYPVDDMYVKDAYRLSATDPSSPIIIKFKYDTMKDALIKASSRMELHADQLGIRVGVKSLIRVHDQIEHLTKNLS